MYSLEQQLRNRIDVFIRDYAIIEDGYYFLDFDELGEEEQGELVALQIEIFDHTTETYDNPDIANALITLLKDNSPEKNEDFARITRAVAIKYYRNMIQDQIETQCGRAHEEDEYDHA